MTFLHPQLVRRVLSIDVFENDSGESLVLPTAGAVLGFQFRGRVSAGDAPLTVAGVTGVQTSARSYSYARHTGTVLVRFSPQGAACLGVPASELTQRSVGLDELMPRAQIAEITERLMEAPDDATRVAVVERFLVDLPDGGDHQVAHALARLDGATGDAAVAKIAREVGLSERQLERRFLTRVGVTPRRYASLRRFDRAVALAQSSATLADAALAAGYADQSHFNREFRRYAGGAPSEVLSRLL